MPSFLKTRLPISKNTELVNYQRIRVTPSAAPAVLLGLAAGLFVVLTLIALAQHH